MPLNTYRRPRRTTWRQIDRAGGRVQVEHCCAILRHYSTETISRRKTSIAPLNSRAATESKRFGQTTPSSFGYLFYFDFIGTPIPRKDCASRLADKKRLGRKYEKNDDSVYAALEKHQANALRNAKKLEQENGTGKETPPSNIHALVEFLNKLAALGEARE